MTINEIQDQIIKDFTILDDWLEIYDYLISLGKKLAPLDDKYKSDEFAIKGCQSKVWIVADIFDDKMSLQGDSDTSIIKGILSLIIMVFQNQSLTDIRKTDIYFAKKVGLTKSLSPTRANGMESMIKQIKYHANKNT